jgi:hypothetical protein
MITKIVPYDKWYHSVLYLYYLRGPGFSSVDDMIHLQNNKNDGIACIGWCVFDSIFRYNTRSQFESDWIGIVCQHLVPSHCQFVYSEHMDVYGWVISSCGYLEDNNEEPWDVAIRRMRSSFHLQRCGYYHG